MRVQCRKKTQIGHHARPRWASATAPLRTGADTYSCCTVVTDAQLGLARCRIYFIIFFFLGGKSAIGERGTSDGGYSCALCPVCSVGRGTSAGWWCTCCMSSVAMPGLCSCVCETYEYVDCQCSFSGTAHVVGMPVHSSVITRM